MSSLPAEPFVRHNSPSVPVTRTMTLLRTAAPLVRALLLASIVTALILFGLPAVLAIARSSTL